jgi:hypothetical protein
MKSGQVFDLIQFRNLAIYPPFEPKLTNPLREEIRNQLRYRTYLKRVSDPAGLS